MGYGESGLSSRQLLPCSLQLLLQLPSPPPSNSAAPHTCPSSTAHTQTPTSAPPPEPALTPLTCPVQLLPPPGLVIRKNKCSQKRHPMSAFYSAYPREKVNQSRETGLSRKRNAVRITVTGKIPLLGVPLHHGRCSGRAILHLHQPISVITKSPDFLWSLPYSPTCLPISPGSCQPSILCSVQTVIPGSAVAQPQLKLPPQHQTDLACQELLLFLKSQRGLSWLDRHFIAQRVGTK